MLRAIKNGFTNLVITERGSGAMVMFQWPPVQCNGCKAMHAFFMNEFGTTL